MDIELQRLSDAPLPPFDCGAEVQNEFIATSARASQRAGISSTHVAFRGEQMLGFITLAMSTVRFEEHERPPEAPVSSLPAVLVAHLAVDKSVAKQGVGEWLLGIARGVAQSMRHHVGCRFLVVDCAPELVDYYKNKGFRESKGEKRRRKEVLSAMPARTPPHRLFQDLLAQDWLESEHAPTHHQQTELHRAASQNEVATIKALLSAGVSPSLPIGRGDDGMGWGATPLHVAACAGASSAIEVLLDAGADINALDGDCETPLHWAVRHNQLKSVAVLLRLGAEASIAGGAGVLTPLDYAVHGDQEAIAGVLRAAGARHSDDWESNSPSP
jgi:predicted N-acetyltransferase YhbS